MHSHNARWRSGEVVEAIDGMTQRSLSRALDRGQILPGDGDKDTLGAGDPREFCLDTVKRIALLHSLQSVGLTSPAAASLTHKFDDVPQLTGRDTFLIVDDGHEGAIRFLGSDVELEKLPAASVVLNLSAIHRNVEAKLPRR